MPIISVHLTTATTPLLFNNQHGSFLVLWSSHKNLQYHWKRFQTQTCLLTDWIHTKSDLPELETDYEELICRLTIEHRLPDSKIGCCNARRARRGGEQMSCRGRRTVRRVRWGYFSSASPLWQSLVPPGRAEKFQPMPFLSDYCIFLLYLWFLHFLWFLPAGEVNHGSVSARVAREPRPLREVVHLFLNLISLRFFIFFFFREVVGLLQIPFF